MTPAPTINVTLSGVTPAQFEAITKLLASEGKPEKRGKPAKTVSDDEDEDFGKKPLKAEDLEDEDDADTEVDSDGDEEEESDEKEDAHDDEDEDAAPSVSYKELKAAINKYGEKHPDQMRAILLSFNIKSPKELSAVKCEKYWEPIYRKVMAKIKGAKKSKK